MSNETKAPETAPQTTDQPPTPASTPSLPTSSKDSPQPEQTAVAVAQPQAPVKAPRPLTPVVDDGEFQYLMDTARFDQAQRVAMTMAQSTLTPKHLKGSTVHETAANCFRVVNQALQWGMNPFAVMDKTYFIDGRMGYEGQLVAAVVQERAGLRGRLKAEYDGRGEDRRVTVSGTFKDETEPRTIQWTVRQGRTKNMMWSTNPDQKLWYSGVIQWARRHCPAVILGVATDDDLDTIQEQRPAGEVTVMTPLEVAKSRVWEAMPGYGGSDKPALMQQCRDAVKSGAGVDFWEGMLAQIEPPQK